MILIILKLIRSSIIRFLNIDILPTLYFPLLVARRYCSNSRVKIVWIPFILILFLYNSLVSTIYLFLPSVIELLSLYNKCFVFFLLKITQSCKNKI